MIIFTTVIGAIIGWFVLMLISSNVLGLVVRGFFKPASNDSLEENAHPLIQDELKKIKRGNIFAEIIYCVILL